MRKKSNLHILELGDTKHIYWSEQRSFSLCWQNDAATIIFSQKKIVNFFSETSLVKLLQRNFYSETSSAKLLQQNFFGQTSSAKLFQQNFLVFSLFFIFFYGLGEIFEGDSADTGAGKFPLKSMGGWVEGLACADPGARCQFI